MSEKTDNKFLKIYLLIISLVGIIGMSVMIAITMSELRSPILFGYEWDTRAKRDFIINITWVVVFLVLFCSHFPFLKRAK